MFIEDDELRALYQASSAEHIELIESGLMHLEKSPGDADQLNAVLRSMHSLKGDSRMLGVNDAEKVVHQMEDMLIEVQDGKAVLSTGLCDRLYKGIDATRKIAAEAIGGAPANLNLFLVLAGLMADVEDTQESANGIGESAPTALEVDLSVEEQQVIQDSEMLEQARMQLEQQVQEPTFEDGTLDSMDAELEALLGIESADIEATALEELVEVSLPVDAQSAASEAVAEMDELSALLADPVEVADVQEPSSDDDAPSQAMSQADSSPVQADSQYQIESVRVAASQLDYLMNQADELTVTKLGIARRQDDLTDIYRLWEDWSRELSLLNISNAEASGQQSLVRSTQERLSQVGEALVKIRHSAANDVARLEAVSNSLESGIRNLRLLPLSSIFNVFPRLVRDLSRDQGKQIELVLEGGETLVDKRILEELKDPLTHLIRNAIDHGIEPLDERLAQGKPESATIRLRGFQMGDRIGIELTDDGQGLDIQKIQRSAMAKGLFSEVELQAMSTAQIQNLIFTPGFSTKKNVTEISGRGVGLDVVRSNVQKLKGSLEVESIPGKGCQFRLLMNSNLASTHALIVEVRDEVFALPIDSVETLLLLDREELFTFDGQLSIRWQEQPTAVQWLADMLKLEGDTPECPPSSSQLGHKIPCVLMKLNGVYLGLLVDQLVDQEHLVLKTNNQFLSQVPNVRGSAILGSGDICIILEPSDLLRSAQGDIPFAAEFQEILPPEKPQVLLVEDSLVIRTQMMRILSGAGFEVTAAVDGLDGLNKLKAGHYKAIVSDVEMPNMSGLEMTQAIRQSQDYSDLPIVLVTTLADEEDKQRGSDAGASAYLTKGNFDQTLLLDTLRRLM
ncbi:MAG: hybrid sensor histidine kinase/response regulator [Cyanobacteria bacterium P01_F01_bin.42]